MNRIISKLGTTIAVGLLVSAFAIFSGCAVSSEEEIVETDVQARATPAVEVSAGDTSAIGVTLFVGTNESENMVVNSSSLGELCHICGNNTSAWCFSQGYWHAVNWWYKGTTCIKNGKYGCCANTNNWECTNSC